MPIRLTLARVSAFLLLLSLPFSLPALASSHASPDAPNACGDPAIRIHSVQGVGDTSPLDGEIVTIEGVVTGDFQGNDRLRGYFVQEEDDHTDVLSTSSEGVFVYDDNHAVSTGDIVRLTGRVDEYFELTEITAVSALEVCASGEPAPTALTVTPPFAENELEQHEGMLLRLPAGLVVTELYNLGRGGEFILASNDRLFTPTSLVAPGPAAMQLQAENDLNRIVVDDGSQAENPDSVIHPAPALSLDNRVRVGDELTEDIIGVLTYSWSGWYGSDNAYRLQPLTPTTFTTENPRPVVPEPVGGRLRVASFNVLNYFNGPGFPTSRGAETPVEFAQQRAKIIAAIHILDADVIGLMEIENDGYGPDSAISELVDGLNAIPGAPAYAFIDPGVSKIGGDEIAVGILYRPDTVQPIAAAAILDSTVDPDFIDSKNRPALAQTFAEAISGEQFTVVVNHLKSKGSDCNDLGDPDTGDGQGNCNLTRTSAAQAEVDWLASDPTGVSDTDYLIIGDLNSYTQEDPIAAIESAGYINLIRVHAGEYAYSYGFKGQYGYLDHALASHSLVSQVTGVSHWHINADEPPAFDYNDYNQPDLYAPDSYRSSDHDPVVVGLDLGGFAALYLPLIRQGGGGALLTITPTPSSSPTAMPTETATLTPTPTVTATQSPTSTPSATATASATITSQATSTPSPTLTRTPTLQPTSTSTPTPIILVGMLELGQINYDGDVPQVESDEWVEVINTGSAALNVLNWRVGDDDGNQFTFPSYMMQPGQHCRVYTNENHPEHCGFNFGNSRAIWGNAGDVVILKNPDGQVVDTGCWGTGC